MKRTRIILAFLFLLLNQKLMAQPVSIIKGQWIEAGKQNKSLNLYRIHDGQSTLEATSYLTSDGHFGFAFYPSEEGFYAVGINPERKMNRYIFYFKPGDNLQFVINGDDWHLTGDNTEENQEIEKWHNCVHPLEAKAVYFPGKNSTYKDYFPLLEQKLPVVENYDKSKTDNKVFNESFEYFKKYNFLDINLAFLNTPRSAHPSNAELIDYYHKIDLTDLTSSDHILDYPNPCSLIESARYVLLRCDTTLDYKKISELTGNNKHFFLSDNSPIKNKKVKGEMLIHYASMAKDYITVDQLREKYAQNLATDNQQVRFNKIVGKLEDFTKGHKAIDFKFPDINGKEVSLSDFKGKVVYVDVWATWCGPCKAEIPYLAKLEEEFKNNDNIVFMSVSVDKGSDVEKWRKMVNEKQMKGVQLFAGDKSSNLMEPYKIHGIPRFILVGKDGNLISADAPRPSSQDIRPLLKKASSL
jgi:thiol-disulfide isomerase/thioredoxin